MKARLLPSAPRAWRRRALAALLLCAGCSGPPGAGRLLGEDLGTFRVLATETGNSCGPGALGSTEQFDFEVELSRADSELFWDGRAGGRLQRDMQFEIEARVDVEVRAPLRGDPGCTLSRRDRIRGELEQDATGSVAGFGGALEFAFSAREGSNCTTEEQAGAGLTRLPCSFAYRMEGALERAPAGP